MAFLADIEAFSLEPSDDPPQFTESAMDLSDAEEVVEKVAPAPVAPSLEDEAGLGLQRRVTLEAASFPWDPRVSSAAESCSGVAAFAGGDRQTRASESAASASASATAAWQRGLLRWEYGPGAHAESVARGDGEWCEALYGAYEAWRAGGGAHVYAKFGGLLALWGRDAAKDVFTLVFSADGRGRKALVKAIDLCGVRYVAVEDDDRWHAVVALRSAQPPAAPPCSKPLHPDPNAVHAAAHADTPMLPRSLSTFRSVSTIRPAPPAAHGGAMLDKGTRS